MTEKTNTELAMFYLEQFFDTIQLQNIDWNALKDKYAPQAVCHWCGEEIDRAWAEACDSWLNFDEEWYCPGCRDDLVSVPGKEWSACAYCLDAFPEAIMRYLEVTTEGEGFFCPDCLPKVILKSNDKVTNERSRGEGYYGLVAGDEIFFPNSGWYIYVYWLKWGDKGITSITDCTPENAIYTYESIKSLQKKEQ